MGGRVLAAVFPADGEVVVSRYEILRIVTDHWGVTYYEIADLQTGVIYWTKQVPS